MTICTSCGKENASHARFCQVCGTALSVSSEGPKEKSSGTDQSRASADPNETAAYAAGTTTLYAGFWIRALAFLIDGIIVFVATLILGLGSFGTGFILSIVAPWLYEALMVASSNQATLGKMALGLIVTDQDGNRLTFTQATGRHFAKYLSALLLCIGYLIAAFTERKQALHDLIVNTYVVRNYR